MTAASLSTLAPDSHPVLVLPSTQSALPSSLESALSTRITAVASTRSNPQELPPSPVPRPLLMHPGVPTAGAPGTGSEDVEEEEEQNGPDSEFHRAVVAAALAAVNTADALRPSSQQQQQQQMQQELPLVPTPARPPSRPRPRQQQQQQQQQRPDPAVIGRAIGAVVASMWGSRGDPPAPASPVSSYTSGAIAPPPPPPLMSPHHQRHHQQQQHEEYGTYYLDEYGRPVTMADDPAADGGDYGGDYGGTSEAMDWSHMSPSPSAASGSNTGSAPESEIHAPQVRAVLEMVGLSEEVLSQHGVDSAKLEFVANALAPVPQLSGSRAGSPFSRQASPAHAGGAASASASGQMYPPQGSPMHRQSYGAMPRMSLAAAKYGLLASPPPSARPSLPTRTTFPPEQQLHQQQQPAFRFPAAPHLHHPYGRRMSPPSLSSAPAASPPTWPLQAPAPHFPSHHHQQQQQPHVPRVSSLAAAKFGIMGPRAARRQRQPSAAAAAARYVPAVPSALGLPIVQHQLQQQQQPLEHAASTPTWNSAEPGPMDDWMNQMQVDAPRPPSVDPFVLCDPSAGGSIFGGGAGHQRQTTSPLDAFLMASAAGMSAAARPRSAAQPQPRSRTTNQCSSPRPRYRRHHRRHRTSCRRPRQLQSSPSLLPAACSRRHRLTCTRHRGRLRRRPWPCRTSRCFRTSQRQQPRPRRRWRRQGPQPLHRRLACSRPRPHPLRRSGGTHCYRAATMRCWGRDRLRQQPRSHSATTCSSSGSSEPCRMPRRRQRPHRPHPTVPQTRPGPPVEPPLESTALWTHRACDQTCPPHSSCCKGFPSVVDTMRRRRRCRPANRTSTSWRSWTWRISLMATCRRLEDSISLHQDLLLVCATRTQPPRHRACRRGLWRCSGSGCLIRRTTTTTRRLQRRQQVRRRYLPSGRRRGRPGDADLLCCE
ncbi:hypothetical protein BC828DRAFT_38547 [Blastocladiella britannica]|nr:hypothetical protein BC828DRAFT_38547 [Blastocladiella britannica]